MTKSLVHEVVKTLKKKAKKPSHLKKGRTKFTKIRDIYMKNNFVKVYVLRFNGMQIDLKNGTF